MAQVRCRYDKGSERLLVSLGDETEHAVAVTVDGTVGLAVGDLAALLWGLDKKHAHVKFNGHRQRSRKEQDKGNIDALVTLSDKFRYQRRRLQYTVTVKHVVPFMSVLGHYSSMPRQQVRAVSDAVCACLQTVAHNRGAMKEQARIAHIRRLAQFVGLGEGPVEASLHPACGTVFAATVKSRDLTWFGSSGGLCLDDELESLGIAFPGMVFVRSVVCPYPSALRERLYELFAHVRVREKEYVTGCAFEVPAETGNELLLRAARFVDTGAVTYDAFL